MKIAMSVLFDNTASVWNIYGGMNNPKHMPMPNMYTGYRR